jgi:predicted DNA-binding WGR domain protein
MRLELRGGSSAKFWEPRVVGSNLMVRFGRIGTEGQTRETKLATPAAAKAALAKLIAEKLQKGYRPASRVAANPPKESKKRKAAVMLAELLGGKDAARIAREVALAVDDPQRFLATTKHELFEDWDDSTTGLPWLALIEGLNAAGRLADVDWKEAGSEILGWLRKIGGPRVRTALGGLDETGIDERRTDEALALLGRRLGEAGYALIVLDKSSDSFPLMIVATGAVPKLTPLARSVGGAIEHHNGKDLEKLEAERLRALARDRSTNPWRMLVKEHAHMRGTSTEAENVLFELRHDLDGSLTARVRAAMAFAPLRDRPLIEMSLALNDQPASRVAKATREPALCLRALTNVWERDEPYERLAAAAVLTSRLAIKPDGGVAHRQLVDALNLWAPRKKCDAALAKLRAVDRDRLARLADGLVRPNLHHLGDALRALRNVGDATSLARLVALDAKERARAEAYAKKHPSWSPDPWSEERDVPGTMRAIRARLR